MRDGRDCTVVQPLTSRRCGLKFNYRTWHGLSLLLVYMLTQIIFLQVLLFPPSLKEQLSTSVVFCDMQNYLQPGLSLSFAAGVT